MAFFFQFETAMPVIALGNARMRPEESTLNFFKRLFEFPKQHGAVNSTVTGLTPTDPVQFDHSDAFSTSSPGCHPQILSGESTCSTSSYVSSARSSSPSSAEVPQTPKNEKRGRIRSIFAALNPRRLATKKVSKKAKRNVPLQIGLPQNFKHVNHVGVSDPVVHSRPIVEDLGALHIGPPQNFQHICHVGIETRHTVRRQLVGCVSTQILLSEWNRTPPTVNELYDGVGEKLRKKFNEQVECVGSAHDGDARSSPRSPVSTHNSLADTPSSPRRLPPIGGSTVPLQRRKPVPYNDKID